MVYDLYHVSHLNRKKIHQYLYASFFFKLMKQKECYILTISEFTKKELISKFSINSEKIFVTYLSANSLINSSGDEKLKNKYNFDYILFVGNIKPHKNLKILIKAFNLIKEDIPHNLMLVGKKDGFLTSDFFSINQSEDSKKRIIVTGFIDDNELAYLYKNASVFVFPSLYEGFGIPPLEAMFFNCPVISSNAASLVEVCGDAAIYFDPVSYVNLSEKIILLLNDFNLRLILINKGNKNLKRFSWNKCGYETIEIFNKYLTK
jgi:glycosyltransferase involved in cell wall biosynthesis